MFDSNIFHEIRSDSPAEVATLVDRQTCVTHVVALPDDYRAETVTDPLITHLIRYYRPRLRILGR